ncbi:unnamed protein product [Acanthoscelides obtectus]|uniref:Nuclease HARBI1 n=1 Tax=Acanthoscelides obtectus TaxID=200917 RepID=A0A9P0MDQ1_ACAOB|nr:unnamed protein product [Acanthoscelides obtectus]CAK1622025.1 hypothetical protein AOBTE_LOCUS1274 [Acanthoscelides obtectus]
MGASTIRDITKTTCEQIWNVLQPLYMPIEQEGDWIKIADEFYSRTNFPNIIGAIDGKHIRMIQPEHSETLYSCPMDNLTINENNRGRNNMNNVRQYMSSYFISPGGAIPCQYNKV